MAGSKGEPVPPLPADSNRSPPRPNSGPDPGVPWYPGSAPGGPPMPPPPRAAPRPILWITILIAVVVIIVILAGVALFAWYQTNDRWTCPGVAWTIDYGGSRSGYFGSNPQTGCLGYPVSGPTGYAIEILLTLTNSAPTLSHKVTSITTAPPTDLTSVSPPLPITIPPLSSVNFTLSATIPTLTGDYVVHGEIATS
jgi:hypothetical protein